MTHYERLGVAPHATTEEIERAFRQAARAVHPDLNSGDPAVAEARMKELNAIRDTLSDPAKRAAYDESLRPPQPAEPPLEPAVPPVATSGRGRILVGALVLGAGAAALFALTSRDAGEVEYLPAPPSDGVAVDGTTAPLAPPANRARPPARATRAKLRARGTVRLGSTADEVFAAFGPPDRVEPGARSGDATLVYGSLRLEMKNGRVAGGDAAK